MEVHGFNVKEFDISINVPHDQADGKNAEGGSAPNHKNYLWGMGCSHAVRNQLQAAGMRATRSGKCFGCWYFSYSVT
jgi:hypothetical protein